jgi:hypothetical protein
LSFGNTAYYFYKKGFNTMALFFKSLAKALCLVLVLPIFAQAQNVQWIDEFNDFSIDHTQVHQVTLHDEYVYATGSDWTTGAFIIKYTKGGGQVWRRNFAISNAFDMQSYAVVANDNGVYIAGGEAPQAFVLAVNHNGDFQWLYEYEGVPGAVASFNNLAQDASGLYLSGYYQLDGTGQQSSILAHVDFQGKAQWVQAGDVGSDFFIPGDLVLNDTSIYLADGFNQKLRRYSRTGELQTQVNTAQSIIGMVWYDGNLYALESSLGVSGDIQTDYTVNRYSENGIVSTLYQFESPYLDTGSYLASGHNAIAVQANGIYLATLAPEQPCCSGALQLGITQLNLNGELQNQALLQELKLDSNTSVTLAVDQARVYLGGSQTYLGQSAGFVAEVVLNSLPTQTSTPKLLALNDINLDGYQDVAILHSEQDSAGFQSVVARIQSLSVDNGLNHRIEFDLVTAAVEMQLLPDVNANFAPEIAVLGQYTKVVELRDSLTGEYVNIVDFDSNITAHKLLVIPDQNGNGAPELAVLGSYDNQAATFVEIKDSVTGDLVSKVSFNPTFTPKDLALVQDQNGDGQVELAMLAVQESRGLNKIEVRTLQGQLIKNIWPGNRFQAQFFAGVQASQDAQPVAAEQLAIVQQKQAGNGLRVSTVDIGLGRVVSIKGLNWRFNPVKSIMLQDINGNSSPDLALLSQQQMAANSSQIGTSKVEIIDSKTGRLSNQLWQPRNNPVYDIAAVSDVSGNAIPEIATLMQLDDKLVVRVQDSASNQQLQWLGVYRD